MCGFAAIVSLTDEPIEIDRLRRMTGVLTHRGPDDEGYLLASHRSLAVVEAGGPDTVCSRALVQLTSLELSRPHQPQWTLGLGVRRLAIRTPGPAGHQPMGDPRGELWVALNGEIYGDAAIRRTLDAAGWRFTSGSDTETLLAAWRAWGPAALARLNGMWACAVWDGRQRRLTCARDRFGIKPLYYTLAQAGMVLVGSEIKAILAALDTAPSPDWPLVVDYLASSTTDHSESTLFGGIRQVPPGCLLDIDARGVTIRRWDEADEADGHGRRAALADGDDGVAAFHRAFDAAVDDHLASDVRVGASLSGGLDSSSIVMAAARAESPRDHHVPLDVFTAAFDDPSVDERGYARVTADAAGARQHLVPIDPRALIADLPRVLWHQDEPILSTSVLAQWQVMKRVAEADVRVLLDGQGADELLGGYPSLIGAHLADRGRRDGWRAMVDDARASSHGGPGSISRLLARAALERAPASWRGLIGRVVQRQTYGLHPDLVAYWRPPGRVAATDGATPHMTAALATLTRTSSLPALLRFLDRNSMAWSIEARVPFLDRRVAAASRALSSAARFTHGAGKTVLRDPRWSRLPSVVANRRDKNGFFTPEAAWWRGPLRDWAVDVLDPSSVARHGVLDPTVIAPVRDDLAAGGAGPLPAALWRWINIELWMRAQSTRASERPR